jgi:hypothetical protein
MRNGNVSEFRLHHVMPGDSKFADEPSPFLNTRFACQNRIRKFPIVPLANFRSAAIQQSYVAFAQAGADIASGLP